MLTCFHNRQQQGPKWSHVSFLLRQTTQKCACSSWILAQQNGCMWQLKVQMLCDSKFKDFSFNLICELNTSSRNHSQLLIHKIKWFIQDIWIKLIQLLVFILLTFMLPPTTFCLTWLEATMLCWSPVPSHHSSDYPTTQAQTVQS